MSYNPITRLVGAAAVGVLVGLAVPESYWENPIRVCVMAAASYTVFACLLTKEADDE